MKLPMEELSTVYATEILFAAMREEAKQNLGNKYIPKKIYSKFSRHWKANFFNTGNQNFLVSS